MDSDPTAKLALGIVLWFGLVMAFLVVI